MLVMAAAFAMASTPTGLAAQAIDARYVGEISYERQITGEEAITNRATGRSRVRDVEQFTQMVLKFDGANVSGRGNPNTPCGI